MELEQPKKIGVADSSGIPGSYQFGNSYFRDCVHQIDFILVYRDTDDIRKQDMRTEFEENLVETGLLLERESAVGNVEGLTFIKVHIPDDILLLNAQILGMKYVFKKNTTVKDKRLWLQIMQKCTRGEDNTPNIIFRTTLQGDVSKLDINPKEQLSEIDRITVTWHILKRTSYGGDIYDFGINRLMKSKVFIAAYPLHTGTHREQPPEGEESLRRQLYLEWAHMKTAFHKVQPLELIKDYFGEEIGLFFSWLECYTEMLLYASIVGLIVFIYGTASTDSIDAIPSKEICESRILLCPNCQNMSLCNFTRLSDSCLFSKVTYLFDNPSSVFFATFMAFWSAIFIEVWKRRQAVLSWTWDLASVELDDEVRMQYEEVATKERFNPVTVKAELFIPLHIKILRYTLAVLIILILTLSVVAAFYSTIILRITLKNTLEDSPNETLRNYNVIIASLTAALTSLFIMLAFQLIFEYLSVILTDMECPRTQWEYDDSYIFKMFIFEFINYYASLIYVAFFKGMFYRYPGSPHSTAGLEYDKCEPSGCISVLFIQLATTMIGKQLYRATFRSLRPKIRYIWCKVRDRTLRSRTSTVKNFPRWEKDYILAPFTITTLFYDQLELVIQYGFITMFVPAFPLAPLCAFINNIIEIRVSAYKFLVYHRRPVPRKVRGLGAWDGIMQSITFLSIFFNAFIIAFTSDFVPRFMYKWQHNGDLRGYINSTLSEFNMKDFDKSSLDNKTCKYKGYRKPPSSPNKYQLTREYWHIVAVKFLFIVLFEHVIILLVGFVSYAIPSVPRNVRQHMAIERQEAIKVRKKIIEDRKKKYRESTEI